MPISIIVAMTRDRVIGSNGKIPWSIKEDMSLFKKLTMGNTVIMGRTTWQSLPERFRPLPGRTNIIVSNTLPEQEGATVCKDADEALKAAESGQGTVFCIGGARLYAEMLPIADVLHISWVNKSYEGDAYFPEVDFFRWRESEAKEFREFTYRRYVLA